MSFRVNVRVTGVPQVVSYFGAVKSNDLPITMAASLTRTAGLAQTFVRTTTLPQEFILRRPAWAKSGIRIVPATKTRWVTQINDINAYMLLQATGGEKLPHYGRYIAVPLSGARPSPQDSISTANLPHQVMADGGFIRNGVMYKVKLRRSRGGSMIPGRRGTGADRAARADVLPMYKLVERAAIPARYTFVDDVTRVVRDNWVEQFRKAWEEFRR